MGMQPYSEKRNKSVIFVNDEFWNLLVSMDFSSISSYSGRREIPDQYGWLRCSLKLLIAIYRLRENVADSFDRINRI